MEPVGRAAELAEIDLLLEAAAAGSGGVLNFFGPSGSGKTMLIGAAAHRARSRGFEVLGAAAVRGQPGRLLWAQLLTDAGADEEAARELLHQHDPVASSAALRALAAGQRRLIVIDDVDVGGTDALEVLALLAARIVVGSTAVVTTAAKPLGVGRDSKLAGLHESELAAVIGARPAPQRNAIWVASGGLPGTARKLASQLDGLPPGRDPLVHLALHAVQRGEFLHTDDGLIRLLEAALAKTSGDGIRAMLLARMSCELLGDPLALSRRRSLADEALRLARRAGDDAVLAEVLDARLYALWDPAGAGDRLETATALIQLGRAAGDGVRERAGLFWRFVALMELARVDEAEVALGAFERAADAAGDAEAVAMALSRHAMLAMLRGRFDVGSELMAEFSARARQIGLPDAARLESTVLAAAEIERGGEREWEIGRERISVAARRFPGHLYEATEARILLALGRRAEAAAELERLLPQALAASGPRWLGAVTDLSAVAAEVGNRAAAAQLYEAVLPYAERLVVWGGANAVNGPASYFLGLLANRLGMPDRAIAHLESAINLAEAIGALPTLAHCRAALSTVVAARGADGDDRRASQLLQAARELAWQLQMTALLDRLSPPANEWALRRDGDDWLLEAGGERARLPDSRGIQHLRALLAAPRHDVSALDLAAGGHGLQAAGADPVLDKAATASYQQRLRELGAELDAADAAGDEQRAAKAEAEREWLLAELRRASGLGGRMRRTTSDSERARVNVTRTLRAALDRISVAAPQAGAHLKASIRTGLECRYDPAPGGPAGWHL
jgi:RecA/RadA recombinase